MTAKIGLVDDHVLIRKGLATLVTELGFSVIFEADNGLGLVKNLNGGNVPDMILMDINMPKMDGYESAVWVKENFPSAKILALSMYDDETSIIKMLKSGAGGYILKDSHPSELKSAIDSILSKGFYISELVSGKLIYSIHLNNGLQAGKNGLLNFSKRELEFLEYLCTELSYREIASKMHLSPRTIDGYRDELFLRLGLKNRIGLVLFAIKNKIIRI